MDMIMHAIAYAQAHPAEVYGTAVAVCTGLRMIVTAINSLIPSNAGDAVEDFLDHVSQGASDLRRYLPRGQK